MKNYAILIILIVLSSCSKTPEQLFDNGVEYYKKQNYDLSFFYFNQIKKSDVNYDNAREYIIKIDSVLKINDSLKIIQLQAKKIKDSIIIRKQKIKQMFSSWDGSHQNLTKWLKQNLNNPESYKHVKTTYRDLNNKIYLNCVFRAQNKFGGIITQTIEAYSDLDGNVTEIIKYQ